MNFGSDAIVTPNPNFVNFGLASVNKMDKLGSVSVPTTRVRRPTSNSDRIRHVHDIEEETSDRVIETRANSNYILKSDFENMREIQDFEQINDPPPLTQPT